ncbi:nucleotide-binding universal stress UspA family protein [Halarchaeum solikamskense]|uniref:universal stress protein n=1 Tax=Halarchaeum nitratireducens TaxID=489913 RepID=UPI001B3AC2A9|nr:universal stress protein [Halarchaeum solikamskense]MBP2249757.1 nucleotide-binding universal stress UspA family protein [Halarchaeum solikamskense]
MYEILVPLDDPDRADKQIESILDMPLQMDEVRVTLLHVFTDNPEGASVGQIESVHEAQDLLDDAGVETNLIERSGDPSTEIVEAARGLDADLIALAGRSRSPTGKAVFGSTTQRVILEAERPVVVQSVSE